MAFYQPKKPGEENNDVFNGFSASAGAGQVDTSTQQKSQFGSLMSYLDSQSPKFDRSKTGIEQTQQAGRAANNVKALPTYKSELQMADSSAPVQRINDVSAPTRMDTISAAREQSMGGGNFKSHDATGNTQQFNQQYTTGNALNANSNRIADRSNVVNSNPLMNSVASYAATNDASTWGRDLKAHASTGWNTVNGDARYAEQMAGIDAQLKTMASLPQSDIAKQFGITEAQRLRDIEYNAKYNKVPSSWLNLPAGQQRQKQLVDEFARQVAAESALNNLELSVYGMTKPQVSEFEANKPQALKNTQAALYAASQAGNPDYGKNQWFSDENLKTDITEMSEEDITNILNELSGVK